jgi:hypothetical protein
VELFPAIQVAGGGCPQLKIRSAPFSVLFSSGVRCLASRQQACSLINVLLRTSV